MVSQVLLICIAQAPGTWPMWGAGTSHESLQLMRGNMSDVPVIKWRFASGNPIEWQFASIGDVDEDGDAEVVVGTDDHIVYCLDGATGTLEWQFDVGGQIRSSAAIADIDGDGEVEVVLASTSGYVCAVNGKSGALEWDTSSIGGAVDASPAIADVDGDGDLEVIVGVYTQFGRDNVFCLSGATGDREWSFRASRYVYSSPAVADVDGDGQMEVVVGSHSDSLYCISGETGNLEWAFPTGGDIYSSPALADLDGDGTMEVVFGSYDYNIYCVDGATGTQNWSFPTTSFIKGSPAIGDANEDGILDVIMGSNDRMVYCLNGATGQTIWSYNTGHRVHMPGSLADIDMDGHLEFLIPAFDGSVLICLNANDGSLQWQVPLAVDVHSPFVGDIDGDQCSEIIVGTQDPDGDGYRLFALDDINNTSDCGVLYSDVNENTDFGYQLKPIGRSLYLFLPNQGQISLTIYDASGRLVQTLYNGLLQAGVHTFAPDARLKGVYLVALAMGDKIHTVKIVL